MHNDDTTLLIIEDSGDDSFIIQEKDDINKFVKIEKEKKDTSEEIHLQPNQISKSIVGNDSESNYLFDVKIILDECLNEYINILSKKGIKAKRKYLNHLTKALTIVFEKYLNRK